MHTQQKTDGSGSVPRNSGVTRGESGHRAS